jgi:hypothetical protein
MRDTRVRKMSAPDTPSMEARHSQSVTTPTLAIVAKILSEPNVIAEPTDSSRDTANEVLSHK